MSEQGYDTWEELLENESNGWVVVVVAKERTPKEPIFVNSIGPFPKGPDGKRLASNYAATTRRRFKSERGHAVELVKVSVRPLWRPVP